MDGFDELLRTRDLRVIPVDLVAIRMQTMGVNDIFAVADLTESIVSAYPTASGPIVIKYNELHHSYRSHPGDISGKESLLVQTLRKPMHLFQDDRYPNTVNFANPSGLRNHVFVSVEIDHANPSRRTNSSPH